MSDEARQDKVYALYAAQTLELVAAKDTNAELLSLLERHHAAMLEEDQLVRKGSKYYIGTKLYRETEAALKPTEDPLRTRVPVWRCPDCKAKFKSGEALVAHRADWNHEAQSALKERV